MPRVPSYGQPRVGQAPIPGVRVPVQAPLEAFGGGESAAAVTGQARGLARDVSNYALEMQIQADQDRLREERRAFNDWERAAIYDPEKGAINQTGKNSFGLQDTLLKDFDDFVAEREKGLGNEHQRRIFRQAADQRRAQVQDWVTGHVHKQVQVVNRAEREASIESAKERASVNEKAIPTELGYLQNLVQEAAEKDGLGPEAAAQMLRRHETDFHARVINRMLAQERSGDADAYYKKFESRMDPDASTKLKAMVQEGSLRATAQREEDRIMSQATTLGHGLEEARKIEKPELRDEVVRRVKQRFQEEKAAEEEAHAAVYEELVPLVEQNPGVHPRELVPSGRWTLLKTEYKDALVKRAFPPAKNDDKAWLDLVDLARTDPRKLAAMSRAEFEGRYWSRFNQAHRDRAETLWKAALEDVRKERGAADKLTDLITPSDVVSTEMKRAKLIPWSGELSDEQVEKRARFEEHAQAKINEFERKELKGQRKASDEEVRTIVRRELARKVVVRETDFGVDWMDSDTEKAVVDLTQDEAGRVYVPMERIPAPALERIKNRLKSLGRAYSDKKAERLYAAQEMDDFDLYESILNEGD